MAERERPIRALGEVVLRVRNLDAMQEFYEQTIGLELLRRFDAFRMHLREATDEDTPTLLAILQAAFEQYRGRLDPPSGVHSETVETIRQKLRTGVAVLAVVDDEVAGCVFYQHEPSHVYLGRLSVLPKYRRRGVGRALIEYVEGRAQTLGIPRVQIGVRLPLSDVRAYYERLGYRVVRYAAHEGYTEPTSVVMEKDLP